MKTSNHDWLNQTPFGDDLWLSMLVDGELSVSQRQAYLVYVAKANEWQKVATAFLDEQVVKIHLTASDQTVSDDSVADDSVADVRVAASAKPQYPHDWMYYLAMAACLVCGLLIGPWLQSDQPSIDVVDLPTAPTFQSNDNSVTVAKEKFQPSLPGLFQVSNTIDEAVYYADFSLPQFMLDALVLAGHRVTFDQEFLGYTETSDNPSAVPINVIHIQKYGRLLAAVK